jgi:hypothetical protein
MAIEISRYQFHSWARKGIASTIEEPDDLGAGTSSTTQRAQINLPMLLNEGPLTKNFSLVGPGDIIGINRDMIVRTQPLHWITDFEPNFLAFAEFYDEDFLWRYTPASPNEPGDLPGDPPTDKLRPWLFLLVVKEDEFERTKKKVPLPSITLKSANVFPPANETWLWAHVHSDANIPDEETNTLEEFLISLNRNVTTDPDQLYCRLISPRKLEPNTPYYAFLIPAFETGRLAGLGESEETIGTVVAQTTSWSEAGANGEMPVYFEWFFRTGQNEDFESLIRKLEPVEMDERVGIRDMDCSEPGFLKADAIDEDDEMPGTTPEILGLEGALKSPKAISTIYPQEGDQFQTELEKIANLPITIIGIDEDTGDPVISVPLYGGNHAKKSLDTDIPLDITENTWFHDLNKDPRTRVAAGFGTLAIQKNQETYMRKAWAQIQTIIDANKRIKATVFHMNIALKFSQKVFQQVSSNVLIAMSRPVLSRVMGSPTTLYQQIKESRLPAAVFSGTFRKLAAPNRRFSKKYNGEQKFEFDSIVMALNDGIVTAAPSKETPGGVFTLQHAADKISPYKYPGWMIWVMENKKVIAIVLLVVFILLAFVTGLYIVFVPLVIVTLAGYYYINKLVNDKNVAAEVADPQKELDAITNIPPKPKFSLKLDKDFTNPPPTATSPASDSVEAGNYRRALVDMTRRLALKEPEKEIPILSLNNTYEKIKEGINPYRTFSKRLAALVKLENIKADEPETILPAMAYPDMDDPMYKKLTDISEEAFLPNLQFIKNNTISLLVTNPRFIESYMVGLNHEMGRELLWREYPTDQRGSYFRQFWDVSGMISPSSPDGQLTAQEKALFKDITPIHIWDEQTEALGTHNNRQTETDDDAQLVLTIRGDLLKKYPNTLVFAQKAIAAAPNDEDGDEGTKIELELSEPEFRQKVKFPLYRAEVQPDIKFFGFDLTVDRARGTTPGPDPDQHGWYFVIMQAPGAPTFGMDISFNQGNDGLSWDDLSWESFSEEIKFIKKDVLPTIQPTDNVTWAADSASMAYILFQKPNMIAVHARKMLKGL